MPRGQWEACRALNMSTARTYSRIVIPQALPASLPGMGNYLVGIFKDTPMLSTIGVAELMHTANRARRRDLPVSRAVLHGGVPVPDHFDTHGRLVEEVRGVGLALPGGCREGALRRSHVK